MVNKQLLCSFALTLASTTLLLAQHRPTVVRATHIIVGIGLQQPGPDSQHKIFSNVGPANDEYQLFGFLVSGPKNAINGVSESITVNFFLGNAGYTLTKVEAPIQYYGSGHNYVQVCLYSDKSGVPGSQIGKCVSNSNLPEFGTTNTLTTFDFAKQGLSLSANTQYWIVAQEPSKGPNADAVTVWDWDSMFTGSNVSNGGWSVSQPNFDGVMAVYGQ
jgi:hypothetical protein